MEQEKEKTRIRPKKEDDGPIEDPAKPPKGDDGKAKDLKEKAEKAKKEAEKYRKRSRERTARIEKDDQQPGQKYRQRPGQ